MTLKQGQWSYAYDKCIVCSKTDKKHVSNGICQRCYFKFRYKNNCDFKLKWKNTIKRWRDNNKEKSYKIQLFSQFKLFIKKYPEEAKQIIKSL